MTILKKILVLVDGSERTIQTVNYVKNFMPIDENTQIVLFHVFDPRAEEHYKPKETRPRIDPVTQLKNKESEKKSEIWWYLERAKKILTKDNISKQSIEIKLTLKKNGIARDIIDEAHRGYSAVIMRRRGVGALRRIIIGSVASKLLQSITSVPILVVGQVSPNKKILLAVDSSPSSERAVEFIASLLGGRGYEACIFHAITGLDSINFKDSYTNASQPSEIQNPNSCIEAFKLKICQLFQATKNMLLSSGFESEKISERIITGVHSRALSIIQEAEEGGFSTIAVGRRSLSKVEGFFMGRVGHQVVYGGDKFTVWVV